MSNTLFYFKGQFVQFPKNQISSSDIGIGQKYLEISGSALDRYNECITNNIRPSLDYVLNGGSIENDILNHRKRVLSESLENSYLSKQFTGFTYQNTSFKLDLITKNAIADWNQMIEKEAKKSSKNNQYTPSVQSVPLTDANGNIKTIPISDWDDFFIAYGQAYGSLAVQETQKRLTIQKASTLAELSDSLGIIS